MLLNQAWVYKVIKNILYSNELLLFFFNTFLDTFQSTIQSCTLKDHTTHFACLLLGLYSLVEAYIHSTLFIELKR
ncbi:hypothetical protein LDENG_00218070 [Lucifuga dentata]|nr:hypothetical protein LDENG_00218070 [Lucifuga dentata]